ncbi:DNA-binding response regulator, partial [Streptomyces sp. NPDC057654]
MSVPAAGGNLPAPVAILLVEDDEVIRRSVTLALERYG